MNKERISSFISQNLLYFILITLMFILTILSPTFLTTSNLLNIVRQVSVVGIIAIGVTMIIITTGIDLSSGAVVALVSVVVARTLQSYPTPVGITAGLLTGTLVGVIIGLFVAKGQMAPFIVTLAMMTVARGFALIVSNGRPIGNLPDPFLFIGKGFLFGIPLPIFVFASIAFISNIVLNKTKFGSYIYAIGGNEQAAIIAGVNVDKYKIMLYAYNGLLVAIAAMTLTARISAGQPTAGVLFELDAIAATIIGGTSFKGGTGTINGTIIGILIIGVMNNGLDLLNVSPYWQGVMKGIIVAVAVLIDLKRTKSIS